MSVAGGAMLQLQQLRNELQPVGACEDWGSYFGGCLQRKPADEVPELTERRCFVDDAHEVAERQPVFMLPPDQHVHRKAVLEFFLEL